MKQEMKIPTYTVWLFPLSKRYYLTHPWEWFGQLGRNIRATYMRAKYGWTYSDVWNWDQWFMNVTPSMFRYLAEHSSAYPGHEPFETPEKWCEWLNEMANLIETGREDWQDEHNEYYEAYLNESFERPKLGEDGMWHHIPKEPTELSKKCRARTEELYKQGDRNVRFALSQIAEHFYNIWD